MTAMVDRTIRCDVWEPAPWIADGAEALCLKAKGHEGPHCFFGQPGTMTLLYTAEEFPGYAPA